MDFLGIDVGKHDVHAFLLQGDRSALKSVPNSSVGFKQLQTWLRNRGIVDLHVCLEATGGWSEDVALALCDAGYVVSLVNPARIKAYAQSEMLRTKTDRIDAGLIARFCSVHKPERSVPPARRFAERLRARHKSNLSLIAAVMRKLLTLAYGVLKSGQSFDPTYANG